MDPSRENPVMELQETVTVESCSAEQFSSAVDILICKPHAANKKLAGCMILQHCLTKDSQELEKSTLMLETEVEKGSVAGRYNLDENCRILRKLVLKDVAEASQDELLETIVWQLPKTPADEFSVAFHVHHPSPKLACPFRISLGHGGQLTLHLLKNSCDNSKRIANSTFRSLVKWCSEKSLTKSLPSLRLIPLDIYQQRYNDLKNKYAKKIIQKWTEQTDPEKFVHEDLAIAAYLCLIWEEQGPEKKPSFVDLGCGNGLLVYILAGEGYRGTGLDLRKRKIWDTFGDQVDLRVETITPDLNTRLPQYDWLIGNHSDELTPWIPVVASMTSAETKFFVLPCCPFEFRSKFQRRNQKISLYRDYLDYVKGVGETCGFIMEEDRLRIPSTKRVCFIGRKINYQPEHRDKVLAGIKSLLSPHREGALPPSRKKVKTDNDEEGNVFVPRPVEIKVRNCTQVARSVKDEIVGLVVKKCLEVQNPLQQSSVATDSWNAGGRVRLGELAEMFPSELLRELKSECGGIQTLLRNHNFIFVVEGGFVRLRCHATDAHSAGKRKKSSGCKVGIDSFRKTKMCWFFANHPQGCPVTKEECLWAHGENDLLAN